MKTEEKVIVSDPDYYPPIAEIYDLEIESPYLTPVSGDGYEPPTEL